MNEDAMQETNEPLFSDTFTGIWLERSLIENKELSLNEKVIYSFINNIIKNGKHHRCWTSHNYFCKLTGLSDRAIRNLKERLKEKGYIDWKTTAIRRGESYLKVCEYFDMKNQNAKFVAGKNTETADNAALETAESAVNINNNRNVLVTNTESYFNQQSYDFIDAYPNEISTEYIASKEILECIDSDSSLEDREETIHIYLPDELLDLSGRKKGFVPMYMDDAYYMLLEGNASKEKREMGASILKSYFICLLSGKRASQKLFDSFVRCLIFDLKIKNGKYIQWYKRPILQQEVIIC